MLGFVALVSLAAYLITPETAAGPAGDPAGFAFNLRYAAPALALCFTVLPLAPAFDGPGRQSALVVVLAVVLLATVPKARCGPTGTPRDRAGRRRPIGGGRRSGGDEQSRTGSRSSWRSVAALLLLAGAAAGYALQRHYLHGRYVFHPGVSYLAHVWAFFRTVHDARVGIVGTFGGFFSYPLWRAR